MTIYRGKMLVVSLLVGISMFVATGIAQERNTNTKRPRQRPERTREEATGENFKKFQQMPRRLDRKLNLTETQREQIAEILKKHRSEIREEVREQMEAMKRDMRQVLNDEQRRELNNYVQHLRHTWQSRPQGRMGIIRELRQRRAEGPSAKEGRPERYRRDELGRHRLERFRELRRKRRERMSEGKMDKAGNFQRNLEERRKALRREKEKQREETTPESPGATTK